MIKRLSTTPFPLIPPVWNLVMVSLKIGVIRFFKTFSNIIETITTIKIPLWFSNSFHDPFCLYNVQIYISAHLDRTCHFFFIIFSIVTIDCTSPVPALVNIFLTNPVGSIHLPSFNSNMAFRTSSLILVLRTVQNHLKWPSAGRKNITNLDSAFLIWLQHKIYLLKPVSFWFLKQESQGSRAQARTLEGSKFRITQFVFEFTVHILLPCSYVIRTSVTDFPWRITVYPFEISEYLVVFNQYFAVL